MWDYLIVTAANATQAAAYERQLRRRRIAEVRNVLVVPDIDGRRIGSGGSTIQCLLEILRREQVDDAEEFLHHHRILIVHAGGDSRRLPAYSACGKIFVPLPGPHPTLFDRLAAAFLALSPPPAGCGQVVVTSGDALLLFDPSVIDYKSPGVTALAAWTTPGEASRHGAFCVDQSGAVRLYLQKPPLEEQRATGALTNGRTLLDVGVMSFSGSATAALLRAFCDGTTWRPDIMPLVLAHGLDLYREICCAMGAEATPAHYLRSARASGSRWPGGALEGLFPALHAIPMHLRALDECGFLHFGSTRQLMSSGLELAGRDSGVITLNSRIEAEITGGDGWVEGCRVAAPLVLGGCNVVVGVDIREPLALPPGGCVEVAPGSGRDGRPVWFVRCYGVDDSFKAPTLCGMPLEAWLEMAGEPDCNIWDARIFPAETGEHAWRRWLWMLDPLHATPEQKRAFRAADRYSAAEVALLTDLERFYMVRQERS